MCDSASGRRAGERDTATATLALLGLRRLGHESIGGLATFSSRTMLCG